MRGGPGKALLFACFPSHHAGQFIYCFCSTEEFICLLLLLPSVNDISVSPGILWAFSVRLGLQRPHELSSSGALGLSSVKTATVGLSRLYHFFQPNLTTTMLRSLGETAEGGQGPTTTVGRWIKIKHMGLTVPKSTGLLSTGTKPEDTEGRLK